MPYIWTGALSYTVLKSVKLSQAGEKTWDLRSEGRKERLAVITYGEKGLVNLPG